MTDGKPQPTIIWIAPMWWMSRSHWIEWATFFKPARVGIQKTHFGLSVTLNKSHGQKKKKTKQKTNATALNIRTANKTQIILNIPLSVVSLRKWHNVWPPSTSWLCFYISELVRSFGRANVSRCLLSTWDVESVDSVWLSFTSSTVTVGGFRRFSWWFFCWDLGEGRGEDLGEFRVEDLGECLGEDLGECRGECRGEGRSCFLISYSSALTSGTSTLAVWLNKV